MFKPIKHILREYNKSRFRAVGIATGYGLQRGVKIRVPVGLNILLLRIIQTCSGALSVFYPTGNGNYVLGGKAESSPLTRNQCRVEENVGLYIHFPVCIQGVVIN
jgi:hypothetical protein